MNGSVTSSTKSEPGTLKTCVSLRFAGDKLEPNRISELLGVEPTTAYRKGEIYRRSRGHEVRGRTGLWLLSTRRRIESTELEVHFTYLLTVLFPAGDMRVVEPLRALMREEELEADIGCFWHGEHGAEPPVIPEEIRAAFARIGATIETDFDTD
jgi:hypothetical protein